MTFFRVFPQKTGSVSNCVCHGHWKGVRCETSTQPACASSPCGNGGTCVNAAAKTNNGTTGTHNNNNNNGYVCHCPIGFSGPTCHQVTNHCQPDPCRNGATCIPSKDSSSYTCKCAAGFAGAHCHLPDHCQKSPCLNGGTCQAQADGYRCQCVPGYVGDLCQSVVDYCVAKPCANGGLCENLKNDFRCSCRPGFGGKDCSRYVNECRSSPCSNGGTCVTATGSGVDGGFRCECPDGYTGANCTDVDRPIALSDRKHPTVVQEQPEMVQASVNGVLMVVLSVSVPVAVLAAIAVVLCMKNRRRRDQKKADESARMQNEQNSIHSVAKLGDPHVIRNSWDPLPAAARENVYSEPLCFGAPCNKMQQPSLTPAQSSSSLQRQKLLNTDRLQNRMSIKEQDAVNALDRRISVISVDSAGANNQCNNTR